MKTGVIILSVFAAVWAIAGLISIDADWWLWLLPVAISVALASWYWRLVLPAEDPVEGKRIGRLVGFWSAIQGVAIFVAANVVTWLGQPTMIGPAICCIVGLHFLPLARGMPRPLYYVHRCGDDARWCHGNCAAGRVAPANCGPHRVGHPLADELSPSSAKRRPR